MWHQVTRMVVAAGLLAAGSSPMAWAVISGPEAGGNPIQELLYHEGGEFHYETSLNEVSAGADAPYWLKNLMAEGSVAGQDRPVLHPGDTVTFAEHLMVTGDLPLVDWHEVFSVRGWSFVEGAAYAGDGDALLEGLHVQLMNGPDGGINDEIHFSFDELEPGSILRIERVLRYEGIDSIEGIEPWGDDPIVLRQHPAAIIPEPATLSLIAVGASLFAWTRRRGERSRRLT